MDSASKTEEPHRTGAQKFATEPDEDRPDVPMPGAIEVEASGWLPAPITQVSGGRGGW